MDAVMDNDQKKRVARHLLLSSPPGQFDLVLSDLKVLIPPSNNNNNNVLSPTFCKEVLADYQSRSGQSLLLSTAVLPPPKEKEDGESEDDEFCAALQKCLNEYVKCHYSSSRGVIAKARVTPHLEDENNNNNNNNNNGAHYSISIYAERVNLKNYNAGSWKSTYTVRPTDDTMTLAKIEGDVTILAHTFENGNVQLSSHIHLTPVTVTPISTPPSEETTTTTTTSLAQAIVHQLEKWDTEHILQPIHDVYNNISNGTLKHLRRIMPVTRTKFDWNVASHRFVKTLTSDVEHK